MQTILDLKKELIDSGWWDIEERISSYGWGDGKIGYTIWISRPDWHGKDAFSIIGRSVKLHAACDDAFNEEKVIGAIKKLKKLADTAWNFQKVSLYKMHSGSLWKR